MHLATRYKHWKLGRSADDIDEGPHVNVDKDKALKQGVALSEVYAALQISLGDSYINDLSHFGRQR